MKNLGTTILVVFCVIIIIISSLILYKTFRAEASTNKEEADLSKKVEQNYQAQFDLNYLQRQTEQAINNEGVLLNNVKVFKGNDSTDVYNLYDLIQEPTLVYRISGNMCSPCIQFGTDKLKEVFGEKPPSNILFLLSDIFPREKRLTYKNECYSFLNEKETLGLPLEGIYLPFFFVTDKEHKATFIFMPEAQKPLYTDSYLKSVSQRKFRLNVQKW